MFNFFSKQKIKDKDQAVLDQLVKYGSNLAKPHNIDFFVYFPDKVIAEKGKEMIQQRFTDASVAVRDLNKNFLCLVNISMVPVLDALQNVGAQFEAITASLWGKYDGWETSIEK